MSKIDLVIESCYENIDLVGICIESLSSQLFDDQQCYQIKLCAYEAVTNCVKHAYLGASNNTVHICYQIDAHRITLDIADSGLSMDPKKLDSAATSFEINPENPSEGGMGLKIIKSFMDDVDYRIIDGINHLTLVKYVRHNTDLA